ncbi:hypothetical protein [Collimonas humicola]|uniref:hypothetical protein n=1 Tax=Collimonas humicola TaxID=2825886 RepID=UPI001B8ADBCD|nr:hypothetical protein [Collimonas humicola]
MGAMASVAAQQAISAENTAAAMAMAKIKADEARKMALINSFLTGVEEVAKINKKGNQIAADAI